MYTYKSKVIKIVDGDTVDLEIDLGFYIKVIKRVRFSLIDAPELNTDSGKQSKYFVESTIPVGSSVIVKTELDKTDKYGRILGEIFINQDSLSINRLMVEKGYAKYYGQ